MEVGFVGAVTHFDFANSPKLRNMFLVLEHKLTVNMNLVFRGDSGLVHMWESLKQAFIKWGHVFFLAQGWDPMMVFNVLPHFD